MKRLYEVCITNTNKTSIDTKYTEDSIDVEVILYVKPSAAYQHVFRVWLSTGAVIAEESLAARLQEFSDSVEMIVSRWIIICFCFYVARGENTRFIQVNIKSNIDVYIGIFNSAGVPCKSLEQITTSKKCQKTGQS